MNRQTILAAIHRQLRESRAESGEVRPLGEVVGLVAEEIRASRNGEVLAGVIPIETVAAFVDGELSAEESEAVCQAVMVDNSVLAELVSAVRAMQPTEELPPLSDQLRGQLMAMQASMPLFDAAPETDLPIAEEAPEASVEVEAPAESLPRKGTSNAAVPIRTAPPVRPEQNSNKGSAKLIAAILSLAATFILIVFLATQDRGQDPQPREIVQNEPPVPAPREVVSPEVDDAADIRVAESGKPPRPPREPVTPNIKPKPDPSPAVVQTDPPLPNRSPVIEPEMQNPDVTPTPDSPSPDSYNVAQATEISGLRWTKVTGLVTQPSLVAATSQSNSVVWESLATGPAVSISKSNRPLSLRTLPMSRAEATLQSGGRVVIAADSSVEVSRGGESTTADVRLAYGNMALVDLPEGTLIRLIKAGHPLAFLRWQSRASVVLQHGVDGMQVHVRGGTIDVNRQPQKNSSVAISRNRQLKPIDHPKREPAWVDRPVATINVKQPLLAQIGQSQNVVGTLHQQVRSLAANPRATDNDLRQAATLASWQAALAGDHVFRLAASPIPVVRMAALNRVAMIPRWDPRYQRTWAAIENRARDKQRVTRFKRLMFLAQQNGVPNAAQINAMLEDLTAADIGSRAMSDYLLRRFHAKAAKRMPSYDPTWTGQAQLRAANQWRSFFGRAAANGQQPAAAVDRLRN